MATLTWQQAEQILSADLPGRSATTFGRRADADVVLANETVSRSHFVIKPSGDGFVIENLSQSTETRVGGEPIRAAKPLADGEVIEAGNMTFLFHDLSQSLGRQEVSCSHCRRSNGIDRLECWYCGTSMVNALTAGFKVARPWCRLVAASGTITLFSGQSAAPGKDGSLQAVEASADAKPVILADDSGGVIPADAPGAPLVDGSAVGAAVPLRHGLSLEVGGRRYLVLLQR